MAVGLGTVLLGATLYRVASTPEFVERWLESYYEGNLAGREYIFASAAEMILEKPLYGWHVGEWLTRTVRQSEAPAVGGSVGRTYRRSIGHDFALENPVACAGTQH
jgi:O-antigen ligase